MLLIIIYNLWDYVQLYKNNKNIKKRMEKKREQEKIKKIREIDIDIHVVKEGNK